MRFSLQMKSAPLSVMLTDERVVPSKLKSLPVMETSLTVVPEPGTFSTKASSEHAATANKKSKAAAFMKNCFIVYDYYLYMYYSQ